MRPGFTKAIAPRKKPSTSISKGANSVQGEVFIQSQPGGFELDDDDDNAERPEASMQRRPPTIQQSPNKMVCASLGAERHSYIFQSSAMVTVVQQTHKPLPGGHRVKSGESTKGFTFSDLSKGILACWDVYKATLCAHLGVKQDIPNPFEINDCLTIFKSVFDVVYKGTAQAAYKSKIKLREVVYELVRVHRE